MTYTIIEVCMKIITIIFIFFLYSNAHADEFSDYNKDISGEAKASTKNIYNAWADNMTYNIKNKNKDGIIINGEMNDKNIESDGFGNVTIKKGANVGPIIIDQDNSNATIIFNKKRY